MSKNEKLLTQQETYKIYFSDKYKTFESFYSAMLKKGVKKIPQLTLPNRRVKIKESDIISYFNKINTFEEKKSLWIERLDDINMCGNLQKASEIIKSPYQTLYGTVTKSSLGPSVLKRLEDNENDLLKLID